MYSADMFLGETTLWQTDNTLYKCITSISASKSTNLYLPPQLPYQQPYYLGLSFDTKKQSDFLGIQVYTNLMNFVLSMSIIITATQIWQVGK